jgi:hypothetical protein
LLKYRSYENRVGLLGFVHESREFFAGSFGNSNRMTEVPSIGFSRGSPTEQFPYVGFTIDISRTESKFTFSVEKGEQGENNQQRNAKSEKTKKSGKGNQADTDDKPATPTAPTRWSTNLERVISNCRTAFLAMTKSFTFPEL